MPGSREPEAACGASEGAAEDVPRPRSEPFGLGRGGLADRARRRRRGRVLHVAGQGRPDPQRDRGAEQRLAVRPPGWPRVPVGEVDGARLLGGRRRRARKRARDRLDGGGELARRAPRPGRRRLLRPAPRPRRMCGAGSGRRRPGGVASPRPRPRRRYRRGPAWAGGPRYRRPRAGAPLRRRVPAGAGDHAAAELAAAGGRRHRSRRGGGDRGLRRPRRGAPARRGPRLRLVDSGDDRAPGRGHELLPADLRRRRGGAVVRPHPDVRLARRRGRDRDGGPARAQARRGRRGARDRGRVRLTPERRGAA